MPIKLKENALIGAPLSTTKFQIMAYMPFKPLLYRKYYKNTILMSK